MSIIGNKNNTDKSNIDNKRNSDIKINIDNKSNFGKKAALTIIAILII